MKRNSSQHSGLTQRSDYISAPNDVDTLKSSLTQSSNVSVSSITGKKPIDVELSGNKTYRGEGTKKNYEAAYLKLAHLIQEAYLEIKYQTIENNPLCSAQLRKSIPLDEDDEMTLQTDPIVLFQYIKQIYDKNFELKNSAERDLSDQKDSGVNDYEAMLQKLEAEVRQHIRIEQQLKLYVESTQAKLEDFEKNGDLPQVEDLKKVIQDLRTENSALTEKLKRRTTEIETFFKDLNHKNGIIKKLEQQLESIPVLKSKIREMEGMLNSEAFKSSGASTLRTYNRTSKEGESLSKAITISSNGAAPDGKSRKNSQPFLGVSSQDLLKRKGSEKEKEKDKNKENYDVLKMEMAKYNGDMNKLQFDSFRLNSDNNRTEKTSAKHDLSNPKTSRQTEKSDDFRPSKSKKTGRSESSSNLQREKSKATEYDGYSEERMANLRMMGNLVNNDMIEQSRFGSERLLMDESQRRMLEKKRESKGRNEYRETPESGNLSSSRHKIPKSSRPSTGHERQSYCPDYYKAKKEPEVYDLSKLKASPQKGSNTDRSQSVDAKTRFYKEMKSRGEQYDKPVDDKARRRSAYNIQSKQNALNVSQKAGVF